MIDFTPPSHVQATVSDIHRFINNDLKPIEQNLAGHLQNEHLYLREDGRLAPEVLEAQRTIRKKSADRAFYALHMPKQVGGGGFPDSALQKAVYPRSNLRTSALNSGSLRTWR